MSKQFQFKLVLLGQWSPPTVSYASYASFLRRIRCGEVQVSHCHFCLALFGLLRPLVLYSLVLRFVKDQFDDYRESTIGGM